ncbi:hypothetical protein [Hoyosella subflava]|uniref:Uncharacterized protein n=1 Tax=Hoyosella subflava (strain DSM 45089 / JCM 17490 / NBRC 109087 / DQS3-9A1) TaxID=443218 RepID=F6EQD9_HOYSD|nr:hypothetical protein [Hoyosella subflava]AEF40624.1 hypothetical protein AS9A_2175 [Hoyosella subflava DQS3-9A1]
MEHATGATRRVWLARVAVVLVVVPVGAFYLGPRIYDLTATPTRMHQAIEAADRYNHTLDRLTDHELVTLSAFAALDKLRQGLADVLAMEEAVSAELTALIGEISGDLQVTLDRTGADVSTLVGSLDVLADRVGALRAPVNGGSTALSDSREAMAAILDDVRATAAHVRDTRISAESAANDLSGK